VAVVLPVTVDAGHVNPVVKGINPSTGDDMTSGDHTPTACPGQYIWK